MKTLDNFLEESKTIVDLNRKVEDTTVSTNEEADVLDEAHDIELKPHKDGGHVVHKIHARSGIESDQLKVGEHLSDTETDDLRDHYNIKFHDK